MLPTHHPPRRHGGMVSNIPNASPVDPYSQGVRRRSSTPLSAVLEMGDCNEDDDEMAETKDTDALLDRKVSSSSSSSGPRRRSSAIAGRGPTTSPSDHRQPVPLVGSYLLYTTVIITVLLGPQLGWEIAQLNLGVFHNAKDCSQHPVTTGRCIMFPGHSNAQWVMAVMFWVLGASVGSLTSSIPAEKYGRRFVVISNAFLMILGGLLQTFAPNIFLFALGRFFNGVASGSGSTITSVFLSEIGPPAQKAGFVVAFQATGSIGLVAITLIHFVVTGSPTSWRWIMFLPAVLGTLQLSLAPLFLIESPKWLLVHRRHGEAAAAFHMLYKAGCFQDLEHSVKMETERNVRRQIAEAQASTSSDHHKSFLQEAFSSRSSKQFIISCILCMARQFGGVSAVFYYSSSIFSEAGIADSRVGNVLLSVVNLLAVFMICFYMKKLPRRTTLLIGIGGMICCSIGMTIALINKSGLAVLLTAMYVGFNSVSLSPLPFLVTAEVLPEHIKTKGVSITTFINWFCNLIVGACFPIVAHYTGNYTFLPFTCLLVIFWLCVYVLLPETRNKTVEQIQTEFHQQASIFAKFQKKTIDDAFTSAKEVELNNDGGITQSASAAAAAALAASRRTSVDFVMPSQPIRPALSRSA